MQLNYRIVSRSFRRFLLWRANKIWLWVESFFVTTLVLWGCYILNSDNPFYVHAAFPWPWLAAVIIVLQYGLGPGLFSTMLLTLAMFGYKQSGLYSLNDIQSYLMSGLTLLLICAMFSSSWVRRVIDAEELLQYTKDRLDSLSSSYYLLRLSYDHLENNVITKPYTLRLLMQDVKQSAIEKQGILDADVALRLLQSLVQYCSIHRMGMYVLEKDKLCIEPIASIGGMSALELHDPLIQQAMLRQELSYVSINQLEHAHGCTYLVAIPMMSSQNKCLGYIVVQDMSFWTLNEETLTTMSVMIHYFVESLVTIQKDVNLLNKYPHCPLDFVRQLNSLLYLNKKLHIDSALCAIMVAHALRPFHVIESLKRERRSLDSVWVLSIQDFDVLITLMPFNNETGIQGYLSRTRDFIKNDLGLCDTEDKVKMRSMYLYPREPEDMMADFIHFISKPEG